MHRTSLARVAGCAAVLSICASLHAASYNASTAAFALTSGYSAVTNFSGANLSQATHHYSGTGPVDVFYNVTSSGGSVLHSFTLILANFTSTPMTDYHLQLGTTTQDYYHNINMDADAFPDYLDTDDDADGIADVSDNAPWVANISQQDDDADGWGNAADIEPSNSAIPLNFGGIPMPHPSLTSPSPLSLSNHAGLLFAGIPTSTVFTTPLQVGSDLYWSGGTIAPGAASTLTFTVAVPDGLPFDGFVLRQTAQVPEPAFGAVALAGLALLRRRAASC